MSNNNKGSPGASAGPPQAPAPKRNPTNMTIVMGEPLVSGREVWELIGGGVHTCVSSTATSTSVMDQAVLRYSDALKRLAKR